MTAFPDPRQPHDRHDPERVAGAAFDDLPETDRAAFERLLAGCAACAALVADLRTLRAATRAMPAPARPAGRDFTIDPETARRLRSPGPVGWLRLRLPALDLRTVGATVSALGLAGLLLTAGAPVLTQSLAAGGAAERSSYDAIGKPVAPEGSPVPAYLPAPGATDHGQSTSGGTGTTTDTAGGAGKGSANGGGSAAGAPEVTPPSAPSALAAVATFPPTWLAVALLGAVAFLVGVRRRRTR